MLLAVLHGHVLSSLRRLRLGLLHAGEPRQGLPGQRGGGLGAPDVPAARAGRDQRVVVILVRAVDLLAAHLRSDVPASRSQVFVVLPKVSEKRLAFQLVRRAVVIEVVLVLVGLLPHTVERGLALASGHGHELGDILLVLVRVSVRHRVGLPLLPLLHIVPGLERLRVAGEGKVEVPRAQQDHRRRQRAAHAQRGEQLHILRVPLDPLRWQVGTEDRLERFRGADLRGDVAARLGCVG
mmetsp:Transcript_55480/g.168664  ORF Transcript_55480/g.168664 Transcript_55480/m.168664 type:complete len:238 (-) Transcript_55480:4110-4823(-)